MENENGQVVAGEKIDRTSRSYVDFDDKEFKLNISDRVKRFFDKFVTYGYGEKWKWSDEEIGLIDRFCLAFSGDDLSHLEGFKVPITWRSDLAAGFGLYLVSCEGKDSVVYPLMDSLKAKVCFEDAAGIVERSKRLSDCLLVLEGNMKIINVAKNRILQFVSKESFDEREETKRGN